MKIKITCLHYWKVGQHYWNQVMQIELIFDVLISQDFTLFLPKFECRMYVS